MAHGGGSTELPDVREKGAPKNGQPQILDRRLFLQLLAFTGCADPAPLAQALKQASIEGVVYADVNDPRGVAIVTVAENPDVFVGDLRRLLNREPFLGLTPRPELTMIGRTYSTGFEPDLEDWLLTKPRRVLANPEWPWAIWYPLRRTGAFSLLPGEKQGQILREHGAIGRAYGEADHAHDIRLACHGLDAHDNDFLIGLVGKQLHPLSAVVQAMRKTSQTAEFIEKLGPFFVGKAVRA
jgi:chlorite dismutase